MQFIDVKAKKLRASC